MDGTQKGVTVGGLVGGVIFIFMLAALMPDAISEIESANTTGWDDSAIALWGIISLVIVAGVVVGIWKHYSG